MENRERYFENLDFAKGVLIFLVILGHSIQCGSGFAYNQNQEFFDNWLYKIIYSFHMPAFMIISGFLFEKTSKQRSFFQVLKIRSLRLILPIIVWQSGITLLSILRGRGFNLHVYFMSILESFWFLWSVWWATVVCSLIDSIFKCVKFKFLFHSFIVILTFITPDSLNFSLHKFMYVSFLVGYIAAKFNWEKKTISGKLKYVMMCCIFAAFIVLFVFFRKESYIYISGWSLLRKENRYAILIWDVYRTLIGVLGGGLIIYLIYVFLPKTKGMLIKKIGHNTSGIYILQSYANVVMLSCLSQIEHKVWLNVIESIIILSLCYAGVILTSYIPFASQLFFGQKNL